jgi:tRNA (cytidine32/uridine32-2'-O)-methyltransferase
LNQNETFNNIRIVLCQTSHPGNIGSTARAMKNMGITKLYLVAPRNFPHDDAIKMACSAADVVKNAVIVDTLYEAVKDCRLVIASTARPRGFDLPMIDPEQSAQALCEGAKIAPVALLFGPERMGLSNADLQYAKYRVTIPTSPDYSSLNLAAAVQTLSYEIYKYALKQTDATNGNNEMEPLDPLFQRELPTTKEMEQFYQHLEQALTATEFIMKKHPGKVLKKLRRLFDRAQPDVKEMNILRGILASMQRFR